MAKQALREKLEEKVQSIEPVDPVSQENDGSIVPFSREDNIQSISVVPDFAITLNEARQRIEMLQSFVREMMIPEVDYGIIPGCKKPSLYKSGAEKLCDIFGLSKHVEIINRMEDWEQKLFHYEVKATLINKLTGHIEAEGIGCCNSKERKYSNQDVYNIINTILKMAKKRAIIDAVLSATRSSGIFTQDIEDIELDKNHSGKQTKVHKIQQDKTEASKADANKNQLQEILSVICNKKIPFNKAKSIMSERYKVYESKQLTSTQAEDFILFLKKYRAV